MAKDKSGETPEPTEPPAFIYVFVWSVRPGFLYWDGKSGRIEYRTESDYIVSSVSVQSISSDYYYFKEDNSARTWALAIKSVPAPLKPSLQLWAVAFEDPGKIWVTGIDARRIDL